MAENGKTVYIMPKKPIEAERTEWANPFGGYDDVYRAIDDPGVIYHEDIEQSYCNSVWHEVTEIVWDGNDEAYDAIEELLRPLGVTILLDDIDAYELDEPMPALQLRNIFSTFPTVGFIPPMGRIRREGNSFVILPPEVKS